VGRRRQRLADGFFAAQGVHGFHLRVPALDAVFEIDGEDADIDGFDDVFVELLEAFELADLLFEARVEAGGLEGDADVAGQGFEQFDVFAGEEVTADGAAEADDGDGAGFGRSIRRIGGWSGVLYAAGQVVVQIEQGCCALLFRWQMWGLLRVFEEDVRMAAPPVKIQKAQVQARRVLLVAEGKAMRRSQMKTGCRSLPVGRIGEEDCDLGD
jgi:hypothetical protein